MFQPVQRRDRRGLVPDDGRRARRVRVAPLRVGAVGAGSALGAQEGAAVRLGDLPRGLHLAAGARRQRGCPAERRRSPGTFRQKLDLEIRRRLALLRMRQPHSSG